MDKRIEKSLKRFEYLWHNEILDRCCIAVTAPKDPSNPYRKRPPSSAEDLRRWYLDGEWILKRNLEKFEKTYYAGDALPIIFPYFGTGGHAKYICSPSKVEYRPDTIWIHPSIENYETYDFSFDPDTNPVFQEELAVISYLSSEANGRYFVAQPDNCGSCDSLAQLRGNSRLMMDFLMNPEEVKAAIGKLVDILKASGDLFFQAARQTCAGGSAQGWMNVRSPGRHLQLQCDLSVMISNELFREFITEELTSTAAWLDHAIYHLDGMEQIRHLDELLRIPGINMIQWTQVAGQPSALDFIPQLKKIQKAGKGLVLLLSKHQLKGILEQLSVKGLHLIVTDADSPDEAERIVKFAETFHE